MFARLKKSGKYQYLQIVENRKEKGRVKQRVISTVGRMDQLQAKGRIETLIRSLSRFSEKTMLILPGKSDISSDAVKIGPSIIFERLWKESGIQKAIQRLLIDRRFEFDVERAIFFTVLHRLLVSGSDRFCEKWQRDYNIKGAEQLDLHHLYRAMTFLGEEIKDQKAATPFTPRCNKDLIEESIFLDQRNLFSGLDLVFFDTTSIYFEGSGGSLGKKGFSKDHRPDLNQMVVGAIIDSLKEQLKKGLKSLVGNKGYRKYLKLDKNSARINMDKVKYESRFDGKWVLATNTDLPTEKIALKYKELWQVERVFRDVKTLLHTRPVFHNKDENIRGHVFCSFLALVLRKELDRRLNAAGHVFEWSDIKQDLKALQQVTIEENGKRLSIRTQCKGVCGKVFQAVGVALPPTIMEI